MLHSILTRTPSGAPDVIEEALDPVDAVGIEVVVVRWCGLRRHNAIARYASMARATDAVRILSEIGVTTASLSTAAILTEGGAAEALIGVHCDDERLVHRAADMMRDLGGRPCCFGAHDSSL